jgi:hypothetical protein
MLPACRLVYLYTCGLVDVVWYAIDVVVIVVAVNIIAYKPDIPDIEINMFVNGFVVSRRGFSAVGLGSVACKIELSSSRVVHPDR